MTTLRDCINRSVNLVAVAIVGLSGFAFLPETFLEKDVPDKIDDGLLFLIGLFGIWWYNRSRNRYVRSVTPVVLVGLALLTKIGALIVEFADPESVGDDAGALILFILALGLVSYLYAKAKPEAEFSSPQ